MSRSPTTDPPVTLQDVQTAINDYLNAYARTEIAKATQLHLLYARLWETVNQHFKAGGKRLRPYLVMLSYEAFGGSAREDIIDVAAAWELLHVSMLMHDDIIDRDYTRHGRPNVAGQYRKFYAPIVDSDKRTHYANAAALLAGDLMLTGAYSAIATSNFPATDRKATIALMDEAVFLVIGGELLDTESTITTTNINPQLIAEAKTASYSIVGPLVCGALLAGASPETLQTLRELGTVLGVGYQLLDDMLGIFGSEAQTGKSTSSDLAESKRSSVIVLSFELMSDDDRRQAEKWLQAGGSAHVAELRSLIAATPVRACVERLLQEYTESALELIGRLGMNSVYCQAFQDVIGMLFRRVS